MELWVAGIALLIIATGILVLILCREKIHKGLRIAVVCVLGVLFVAVLGYIALTFLFLNSLDSPPLDVSTASGKVLSEKQAIIGEHKTPVPVPLDYEVFKATPQNTQKERPCGKIPPGRAYIRHSISAAATLI